MSADKEIEDYVDSFDNMNLKESLLRGIYSYGFEKPSEIQAKSIVKVASGRDIIAQSQSGTGKTGSFVIGALQRVDESVIGCQAIIIAPTRELAEQISIVASQIGSHTKIKYVLCVGGSEINMTRNELNTGPCVVIGTPGRIIDMITRSYLTTRLLRVLVLDEADEILSLSFKDQMRTIIKSIPASTQICLYSATMPPEMLDLTTKFMQNPERILVKKEELTLEGIRQFYVDVIQENWKLDTFVDLFDVISVSQSIVYVNTKGKAEWLSRELQKRNFTIAVIHSNISQKDRLSIMKDFRSGGARILISTDLLSRGIDVQQVSIVINFDLPTKKESYIHRIGRSGRFGRKGVAINFITKNDMRSFNEITKHYDTEIVEMPSDIQKYL